MGLNKTVGVPLHTIPGQYIPQRIIITQTMLHNSEHPYGSLSPHNSFSEVVQGPAVVVGLLCKDNKAQTSC